MTSETTSREGVEAVIADLRAGGVAAPGQFTIDREEARRRLAEFRIPDPAIYVLELVQVAVASGATRIEIHTSAGGLRLAWDGAPLTADDLDGMYGALFRGSGSGASDRARQRLALALHALRAQKPRHVVLISGGAAGVRLELDASGNERTEAAPDAPAGTRIEIGLAGGREPEAERALLCERAGYAEIDINLDEEAIARGLTIDGALADVPVGWDGGRGCGGLVARRGDARLAIVCDGAVIAEHEIEAGMPGFFAVVRAEGLRRDLSGWDVVRDDAYDAMVAAVRRAADALQRSHPIDELRQTARREIVDRTLRALLPDFERRYVSRLRFVMGIGILVGGIILSPGIVLIILLPSEAGAYALAGCGLAAGAVYRWLLRWLGPGPTKLPVTATVLQLHDALEYEGEIEVARQILRESAKRGADDDAGKDDASPILLIHDRGGVRRTARKARAALADAL